MNRYGIDMGWPRCLLVANQRESEQCEPLLVAAVFYKLHTHLTTVPYLA